MPGDTVITFNYDVSLDSKLRQSGKWAIGDGYGFRVEGLPTGSTVRLLKMTWQHQLVGDPVWREAVRHHLRFWTIWIATRLWH